MTSSFQRSGWVNPVHPPRAEPTVAPAGLGQRFGAEIADGLFILTFYLMALAAGKDRTLGFVYILWFLHVVVVEGRTGYTVGRWLSHTKVVDVETFAPIGIWRQLGRVILFWVATWLTLGLATLIGAVKDLLGQTIADRAFRARVIRISPGIA